MFGILLGYAKLGVDPNWRARLERYQREAVEIRIFANNVIPIPFQTEDYARGLLEAGHAAGLLNDVEASVAERMELQAAILEGNPRIWMVLDEVALRSMGKSSVMHAQFNYLAELSARPQLSLRVLPLTAAPHIGVDGSFWLFELPGRQRASFAGTTLDVGRVIDDQVEAANVAVRFDRIAARAWSEDQTRDHIAGMGEDHDRMAEE